MLTAFIAGVMIASGVEILYSRFRPRTGPAARAATTLALILAGWSIRMVLR